MGGGTEGRKEKSIFSFYAEGKPCLEAWSI